MLKLVVLSCVLAAASATGLLGWTPYLGVDNYRGPVSLAPGQPANVLGVDGRPLDTLDVNLDRSAHIIAKAYGGHILKKRSVVPIAAPLITNTVPITYGATHLAPYTLPYTTIGNPYGRIAGPIIW